MDLSAYIPYLDLRIAEFKDHYTVVMAEYKIEAIHQARVALKRTRFLFRWMERIFPETWPSRKRFKKLRKAFKAMGTIRDLQVMQEGFSVYAKQFPETVALVLAELNARETRATDDFKAKSSKFDIRAEHFRRTDILELLGAEREIPWEVAAEEYVRFRLREIKHLPEYRPYKARMHNVRTRTKELLYWLELHKDADTGPLELPKRKHVKGLASRLGTWHDRAVMGEQLPKLLLEMREHPAWHADGMRARFDELLLRIHADAAAMANGILAYQGKHFPSEFH